MVPNLTIFFIFSLSGNIPLQMQQIFAFTYDSCCSFVNKIKCLHCFQLQLFDVNFFFPKNKFLASRRERTFMDARPWFRVVNSTVKMMTCYLRDKNKFLRYCTLCTSILKCKFPTKGIELARLKFFEDPRVPQL